MDNVVSQSQFFMWRTLFAVAHADNIVTDEEVEFMAHILDGINFTDAQTAILKDDIVTAKDVEEMFQSITDEEDRIKFFDFARDLVWVDGDFGSEEQDIMIKLMEKHVKEVDIDDMVGNIDLELEEEPAMIIRQKPDDSKRKKSLIDMVTSFRSRFS